MTEFQLSYSKQLNWFKWRTKVLDFKIRISDLQSNTKSENEFQRWDICSWIPFLSTFLFFFLEGAGGGGGEGGKSEKGFETQFLRTVVLHAHA